jgi:hypothetical protein
LDAARSKARSELKGLAARNDVKSARILAKEMVRSNKQVDRLHASKARLGSVGMQLTHQAGMFVCYSLPLALVGVAVTREEEGGRRAGGGGVGRERGREDLTCSRETRPGVEGMTKGS